MAQVTRLGLYGGPRAPYAAFAAAVTASVTGSFTEAQVVAGGEAIVITLVSDTWVASGATFNAQRQNIIDGLDAATSPANGWNNEVRDKEVVGAVVRTSNTDVTITLTASASYDITVDETITVTVPADALTSTAVPITATPTIGVTAAAAAVSQGGHFYPAKQVKTKLRKKDDSIKESIQALLTDIREAPVIIPQKVENAVREVYDKAPEVINIKSAVERTQKIVALSVEISKIRKEVKRIVKEDQDDEDDAIRVLMEIM